MLWLQPASQENAGELLDTSYEKMSFAQKQKMLKESQKQAHQGLYFELLAVYRDGHVIGWLNLFAHTEHIISCCPEIKESFRRQGAGTEAEALALAYAKRRGYAIAAGSVNARNEASVALHEKLGFEAYRTYINPHGEKMIFYIKTL